MVRLPWLCRPAKASALVSDHGTRSSRQICAWPTTLEAKEVDVRSNHSRYFHRRSHFAISAQVLVRSWDSVLAVTTPRVS
ncbi:MAG: hypothetical protein EBY18_13870 [Alphaproteobacteria bacterium]|nr:hypothetical protein [Alphaproteobacteria bacterium]